ncbi:hypothetical protein RhiJN_26217 [Ceratobasidium sp. AG-Ba]|nr:hypothetical protein RhiJN_26217 [Ceratobasidium sp. AG-Ba]
MRRAIPLPQWRSLESLNATELESSVLHAARVEANFLRERPSARPVFQIINTGRKWGQIGWLGQVAGGEYVIIFFRNGMLSVWDVTPEKSGCVAELQTHMDNYTHTCEVLQEEQATLIGLATGAHDDDDAERSGRYCVFKISFPPANPGVSITQVLDAKIDIPITGLFIHRGLVGVVGPFNYRTTAALQIYDWKTGQGILINTGVELQTDCDLDVISFPDEIVLYAEDSKQSVLHTYTVENIRRMLSLVSHHEPHTIARVGGGFLIDTSDSDSSPGSPYSTASEGDDDAPATMQISLPPKRSKTREIKDQGVGTFGAGYTMLKKSHMSAHDRVPYSGKMSVLTMSLRHIEDNSSRVRCITHHFLTPLASPDTTPSSDTGSSASTYLSANTSLSTPEDPLDGSPLKHTFAHTLGINAIVKGPTGYDLISFGEGGTNVVWLARSDDTNIDSDDDDELDEDEFDKLEYTFYVATFPTSHSNPRGEYVRRLKLPRIIKPSLTAALDLDDTQGVLCIATTRGEVFRLRFD